MPKSGNRKFFNIAEQLTREKALDSLLTMILKEAMTITECLQGTIYVLDVDTLYHHCEIDKAAGTEIYGEEEVHKIKPISLHDKDIVAEAAVNMEAIFSPSRIVFPIFDDDNDCISVMDLSGPEAEEGFDTDDEWGVRALSSFAGVLLKNKRMVHERGELLNSFVQVMVGAVDTRSPYNAHHTKNMVHYLDKFLDWSEKHQKTPFVRGKKRDALVMSVWLHDIGKLLIPTEVMDKATRLGAYLKDVLHRITIAILMEKLEGTQEKIMELEIARDFILEINKQNHLSDENERKLRDISYLKCMDEEGISIPLLTKREVESLSVKGGTLTSKERRKIQDHVIYTRHMLDGMNFTGRFKEVPKIAGDHHEFLDGSGYPNHLTGDEIKKETRLITILDIYDALTAEDRPYKPPLPTDKAFEILYEMADEGKLDKAILKMFMESRAWEK